MNNFLEPDEGDTPLNQEFQEAFDNPEDFDFGFEEERAEDGYANFGFDPEEAERMRQEEDDEVDRYLEERYWEDDEDNWGNFDEPDDYPGDNQW